MKKIKSILSVILIIITSSIIGWGAWNNYRPTIVMASCSDIAYKTTAISRRYNIDKPAADNYDNLLNECIKSTEIK